MYKKKIQILYINTLGNDVKDCTRVSTVDSIWNHSFPAMMSFVHPLYETQGNGFQNFQGRQHISFSLTSRQDTHSMNLPTQGSLMVVHQVSLPLSSKHQGAVFLTFLLLLKQSQKMLRKNLFFQRKGVAQVSQL